MKTSDLGLVPLGIVRVTDALNWSRHLDEEQIECAVKRLQSLSLTSAPPELKSLSREEA
jgi:hypothetical protein